MPAEGTPAGRGDGRPRRAIPPTRGADDDRAPACPRSNGRSSGAALMRRTSPALTVDRTTPGGTVISVPALPRLPLRTYVLATVLALIAAVATYVTGELINLAFVLPFFAFLALFFPTEARYTFLLGHRR